ncbi:MAG TPA: tRNA lysidine(34) synthetase TilS [Pseudolabrys sp.]|nr:tRNA lysidine(34) synthetase TilS [Pseudolabrys sp.]
MAFQHSEPVAADEAASLFDDLSSCPALVLAVSGGPDSTALLWLVARWRSGLKKGPALVAVTVDHGLRKEAAAEAKAVGRLARKLGVAHLTLRWTGKKPKTGVPQAARTARYRLLAEAARKAGAPAVLTAHTLDDQAETVLIRMSRGSGMTGLAGMARVSALLDSTVQLIRPLLGIPKARLVATLKAARVPFADDPTNRDPRFTRARLRGLMPRLEEEGLGAARLAILARRLARAEAALSQAAAAAFERLAAPAENGAIAFGRAGFAGLSAEIALRLIGRAIDTAGDEGPAELGKLEALAAALSAALPGPKGRFRRSLAGAVVSLTPAAVTVERAPPRRSRALTKRRAGPRKGGNRR